MKKLILILFAVCTGITGIAQRPSDSTGKQPFKDRLFFGGDIGLSFGTITVVGASPFVGYRITDAWSAGLGATYYYFAQNIQGFGRYSTSIYGGNVFSRYLITQEVFLHSEFQLINTEVYRTLSTTELSQSRRTIPQWYIGGGYRQRVGGNTFIMLTVLYDVLDDPDSPYSNPIFRGGVVVGM